MGRKEGIGEKRRECEERRIYDKWKIEYTRAMGRKEGIGGKRRECEERRNEKEAGREIGWDGKIIMVIKDLNMKLRGKESVE